MTRLDRPSPGIKGAAAIRIFVSGGIETHYSWVQNNRTQGPTGFSSRRPSANDRILDRTNY
jgi:hypothetical protein